MKKMIKKMKNAFLFFPLFAIFLFLPSSFAHEMAELPVLQVGKDFNAQSSLGKSVKLSDFQGKAVLLYFGYSHCPHICPLMTSNLAKALQELGTKAQKVQVIMVSVDPKRDSPKVLQSFLNNFHKGMIGITDEKQLPKIAADFKVTYGPASEMKADQGKSPHGGMKMGAQDFFHSNLIFVMDQKNQVRKLLDETTKPLEIVEALGQLGI